MFSRVSGSERLRAKKLLEGFRPLSQKFDLPEKLEGQSTILSSMFPPRLFRFSGSSTGEQRKIVLRFICLSAVVAFLAVSSGRFLLLALIGVLYGFEIFRLKRKVFQRSEGFERDYTALLLSLASGVKTGLDPLAALSQSNLLFQEDSQVNKEITELNRNIERGDSEDVLMTKFGSTIDHPDLRLFRMAFVLARREGSSLVGCLRRLVKVTRQRQSFRRKVRSAVAMQKLSAIGISGCAVVIGSIQFLSNPEGMEKVLSHPLGMKALFFGVFLIFLGLFWMLRQAKTRI